LQQQALQPSVGVTGNLSVLADSWRIHLEAENNSSKTLRSYMAAARQLAVFLAASGMPTSADAIAREHIETFLIDLREGTSASLRRLVIEGCNSFKWLADEAETARNPNVLSIRVDVR
jgi:site-specific recombinase XerD